MSETALVNLNFKLLNLSVFSYNKRYILPGFLNFNRGCSLLDSSICWEGHSLKNPCITILGIAVFSIYLCRQLWFSHCFVFLAYYCLYRWLSILIRLSKIETWKLTIINQTWVMLQPSQCCFCRCHNTLSILLFQCIFDKV